MQAGDLNSRCVLQAPSNTVDEIGQPVPGWVDVASFWANIRMKSGMETIKSGAVTSTVQASIRARYRSDITAGMRVAHGGVVYAITAVMPDIGGRVFVDLATEVVA
jgi:SPP1 family predicted phage head-tail adaptor